MNEVEKDVVQASVQQTGDAGNTSQENELDYKSLYLDTVANLTKTQEERDNYKKGLLSAKGKIPEDTVKENTELIGKVNYLEEQIRSLANSGGMNLGSSTTQVKGATVPDHGWGSEQVKELQKRGMDDKAIKQAWVNYQNSINKK